MPVIADGVSSLLDIEQIRQLIDMMVANDLVELSLRNGEEEVSLRRPTACSPPMIHMQSPGMLQPYAPMSPALEARPAAAAVSDNSDSSLVEIGSPMVGTFYASPDPGSPSFVQAGSVVHPGTVVCILEAMKVFNEIKAELSGRIERVLVKNGQTVEYGQPLFLVRPE